MTTHLVTWGHASSKGTALISLNDDRSVTDVTWATVEDGFYVGSRTGEFLGYIDRTRSGSFDAFDLVSRKVGTFSALERAMAALIEAADAGPVGGDA